MDVSASRTNMGTIELTDEGSGGNNEWLNLTGGSTLTNTGTIKTSPGNGGAGGRYFDGPISNTTGTITLNESTLIQSGSWSSGAAISVAAGKTLTIAGGASMTQTSGGQTTGTGAIQVNGVLHAVGSIGPDVTNNGAVGPGTSPGLLNLSSSYTQTGSGKLLIEIQGLSGGTQYDQLNVAGPVSLAGTLQVATSAFTPSNGQTFVIVTGNSVTGTFGTVNAMGYTIQYHLGDVTLTATGGPTAARLLSFSGRRDRAGALLRWRMGSEHGLLGYVLYRNGQRLNRVLIPAGRRSYSFRDRRPGADPRYTLYAVGLDGRRALLASRSG
jgi:hypothetical protein